MNTFSIIIFIVIIAVFGGIIYVSERSTASKQVTVPTIAASIPSPTGFMPLAASQLNPSQSPSTSSAPNPTAGVIEQPRASYSAILKTSKGTISLTLFADKAPNTVKNFIDKANSGFYTGLPFHRVEDWVIQGGDPSPKHDGTGGGQMLSEMNDLPFTAGSLGVARGQDIRINNDSQFFITKSDASWLNQQYTNFGTVTKGMDVVDKIQIGDKILGITIK